MEASVYSPFFVHVVFGFPNENEYFTTDYTEGDRFKFASIYISEKSVLIRVIGGEVTLDLVEMNEKQKDLHNSSKNVLFFITFMCFEEQRLEIIVNFVANNINRKGD